MLKELRKWTNNNNNFICLNKVHKYKKSKYIKLLSGGSVEDSNLEQAESNKLFKLELGIKR